MYHFVEIIINQAKTVIIDTGLEYLCEHKDDIMDSVKGKTKIFIDSFLSVAKAKTHVVEADFLDKETIVEIAKKYLVPDSTEVALCKKIKNNTYYMYLAYTKDKELLPVEKNSYVIIKVKALSPDVIELFGENEFILMK